MKRTEKNSNATGRYSPLYDTGERESVDYDPTARRDIRGETTGRLMRVRDTSDYEWWCGVGKVVAFIAVALRTVGGFLRVFLSGRIVC